MATRTASDTAARGRPRPKLFRALGDREPPAEIEVGGELFSLDERLKHDSWAATAIYTNGHRKIVCKFNRQQSIFGFPMRWLGRALASRETYFLDRLADVPNVPNSCGPVCVDGVAQPHAAAHDYVPGRPLRPQRASPAFYRELSGVLQVMHQRDLAYVDLNKAENVIVGDDGRPYLIDFQICFRRKPSWIGRSQIAAVVLKTLALSDRYHLRKHCLQRYRGKISPELYEILLQRPWWINAHRLVGVPIRQARRRILVWLKVRTNAGYSKTEHDPEQAVRLRLYDPDLVPMKSAPEQPAAANQSGHRHAA